MYFAKCVVATIVLAASTAANAQPVAQSGAPIAEAAQNASDAEMQAKFEVVGELVDAMNAQDFDRFMNLFAPDAELYANNLTAKGHKEIRAIYRLNFRKGAPKFEVLDCDMAGEFVFISGLYVMASGEELCCSYSEIEVVDGKITYLSASG